MNLEKQSEMLEAIYWMVVQHYANDEYYVYSGVSSGADAISILGEYGLIEQCDESIARVLDYAAGDKYFFRDKILEKQK